ncbi:hypothetical protein [Sandaracinus amylolyticus]|uniref:hypothetical protein n=1 Tax=Sandaracinus amylolyticus TaxID=927083 RepID=UPI001F24914F|nr:hypothetical protein [Sandaracinus amylolyticus]UJR79218.1 Hypothetical protein I5071_12510 [Sandaracinus amylolyticus]
MTTAPQEITDLRERPALVGHYTLELADLEAAYRAHPQMGRLAYTTWYGGFALLVGVGRVAFGALDGPTFFALIFGALMMLAELLRRLTPRRQIARMSEAQRAITIEIDEHGYRVRDARGEGANIVWPSVREVIVRDASAFFCLPNFVHVVPCRAFAGRDYETVLAIANEKVPPAKHRRFGMAKPVFLIWLVLIVVMFAMYLVISRR